VPAAPGVGVDTSPQNGYCTATLLLYAKHKQSGEFEISGTRAESLTFPNQKGNQVYWDDFNGCREVLMGKTGGERFQGYLLML